VSARSVTWDRVLSDLPLIAILRGVTPRQAVPLAEALYNSGFLCVEVPLNSPAPFESIGAIRARFNESLMTGAGTVLSASDVKSSLSSGAQLIVSPHTDPEVIQATREAGLISLPGCATPGEAFNAHRLGAHALKLFPAEAMPASVVRALKAVLPSHLPLLPVGGITPQTIAAYRAAGAAGFGIGSAIYSPGSTPDQVHERATAFVRAWRDACRSEVDGSAGHTN